MEIGNGWNERWIQRKERGIEERNKRKEDKGNTKMLRRERKQRKGTMDNWDWLEKWKGELQLLKENSVLEERYDIDINYIVVIVRRWSAVIVLGKMPKTTYILYLVVEYLAQSSLAHWFRTPLFQCFLRMIDLLSHGHSRRGKNWFCSLSMVSKRCSSQTFWCKDRIVDRFSMSTSLGGLHMYSVSS